MRTLGERVRLFWALWRIVGLSLRVSFRDARKATNITFRETDGGPGWTPVTAPRRTAP